MKQLLSAVCICFFSTSFSQEVLHCGSDEMEQHLFQEHPEYKQAFLSAKNKLEVFTKQFEQNPIKSGATYIIPVVFHIIHNNGPENISNAQVHDAVRQVNLQYRKQNPDTNQIVSIFQGIAADAQIEIRLAQIDPDGNCTSGITRTVSSLTNPGNHQVKDLIHWPPEKYLNIYVCANAAGLAGHALMPAVADTIPDWDGIVIRHDYVGTIGTSDYFRRTVLSHEIGHYLNLYHIWGGNNVPDFYYLPVGNAGNCAFDDEVMDTPNTIGWSVCNLSANSCGSTVDNTQNYMDYSYCALMFTEGQKVRMHAALNSPVAQRNNLWTAANRTATGTDDVTFQLCEARIETDKQTVCVGDTVRFTDVSSHGVTNRLWSFNGGTIIGSLTDETVRVLFDQPGSYHAGIAVSNGSDTIQLNLANYITVLPNVGTDHGKVEGFEDNLIGFKTRWNVRDVGQNYNWEIASIGYQSNQSIKINNFDGGTAQVYEFFSEPLDLSGLTTLAVSLDWAFAQKIASNADLFQVYISNNCGKTWQMKKTYGGLNTLRSVTELWATPFTPSSINEWNSDTILINGAANFTDHTQLKFRFESKGGNNFFLDNIRIGKLEELGLEGLTDSSPLALYPNPAEKDASAMLKWTESYQLQSVRLMDAQGRLVETEILFSAESSSCFISLNALNSGFYYVVTHGLEGTYSLPLVVN